MNNINEPRFTHLGTAVTTSRVRLNDGSEVENVVLETPALHLELEVEPGTQHVFVA
jgi:hypothetical protein